MERVLITGANGFLGVNVVAEFLDAGYKVRGLLRNRMSFIGKLHPELELVEGDFTDASVLRAAMQDCDYVIHCAAKTDQKSSYESYEKINVIASEQLVCVAIEQKIKKIIYVATANIFAYNDKNTPGDEKHRIRFPFTKSPYAVSKVEAVKRLTKYIDSIEIIIVCPTFMLGAYDSRPSSGRIILFGYGKRMLFYPPGGKNFVHASDVAHGIVKALQKGSNGECYLLANENLSYKEFYEMLAEQTDRHPLLIRLPRCVLLTVGFLGSFLFSLGIRNDMTLVNMRLLCVGNYYDNKKSIRELDVSYRPVRYALTDAIEWFQKNNKL